MPSHHPAILAGVLCVAAFSLIGTLEWQRRSAPPAVQAATKPAIAGIAAAVRSMKLVTWQFETTISADTVSDKWYGNAVASVRAPVKYQYGVDLSGLERSDVVTGIDDGALIFLVPPPERISVEVDLAKLEQNLHVSGARWRSRNQDQVDAARTKLADVAQSLTLPPEEQARLREVSREQLEKLLAKAIEPGMFQRVSVRFVD